MAEGITPKFRVFSTAGVSVVMGLRQELAFEGRTVDAQEDGSVFVSGENATLEKIGPLVKKYSGGFSVEAFPSP